MFALQVCLAVLAPLTAGGNPVEPPAAAPVAVGGVRFDERSWAAGRSPTLIFSTSSGRGGAPEKVAAFLYYSDEPGAFQTSPYPPQFVGVLSTPSSVQVVAYPPPGRAPINEFTREKYVQGALFDLRGTLVDVTNEDYLDILYSAPPVVYALDFESEDDFATPLVNGQDLSTPPEFGALFSLASQQPVVGAPHQGPAVFDTDPAGPNAGSSDPDLLVGLGNALILQENPGQTVPGVFDLPDDSLSGGVIVFDFTGFGNLEKVAPRSVDLIDVDSFGAGVKVFLSDVLGQSRFYTVPAGWTGDISVDGPPGYGTLDLTTLLPQPGRVGVVTVSGDPDFLPDEVRRVEITLLGSGAIDNLVFARESDGALTARRPKSTQARAGAPSAR